MKVNREKFLKILETAQIGLTSKEVLEQSNAFAFYEDSLVTFNDEILTRQKNPLDFEAIVTADDLLKLMAKIPDDEIEITKKGNDLRIKGKRKTAAIHCWDEMRMGIEDVPKPKKWSKLKEGIFKFIVQASKVCSRDHTQNVSVYVHVTPKYIESTDGNRLYRAKEKTGFEDEILIPASCVEDVNRFKPIKVSIGKGWIHFKTKEKCIISVRCSHESFLKKSDVDRVLSQKDAEVITLPKNLGDILSRAEIMQETSHDARVSVSFEDGLMTIKSQKETGWYKEKKKVKYSGTPIEFDIHPNLLEEILAKSRKVYVTEGKMKSKIDNIEFVIALRISGE